MYLTDRQLRERLAEFEIQPEHDAIEFDAEKQIGPCSIDLRLSLVYWTPKRKRGLFRKSRVVDLERSQVMELSPHRGWQRHDLHPGDKISIPPGGMALCRVSERFRMPSNCAGAVEGRSSYARMGLSVHATGGFINPGWRGHMPLTLVNHSPVTLRIPVATPICQLMIVALDGAPEADYAQRSDRKYLNDQGGPSYWWRDSIMAEIRSSLAKGDIGSRTFEEIDDLLADAIDEDFLSRLDDFVSDLAPRNYGNADELLEAFAKKEEKACRRKAAGIFAGTWAWTAVLAVGLFILTDDPSTLTQGILATCFVISIIGAFYAINLEVGTFLTTDVLHKLQHERESRRTQG